MAEINRIAKLFADLQHGDCWIGTNFKETLYGVDATMAAKNISNHTNNIWQLVFHLTYWRTSVINRLNGSLEPPPFKDFALPDDLTEENWKQTMQDFESAYHQLRSTILNFKADNLDSPSPRPEQSYYQLIMGCLQHDAYHLGQIVIIKKTVDKKLVL
ncbi:MAG: DinB family protein [Bacteroidota bacterium]